MDPSDRAKYREVLEMLKAGDLRSAELIESAEKMARIIEDEDHQAEALSDITKALAKAAEWERAKAVARSIPPSYYKADALREIAEQLIRGRRVEEAIDIVAEVDTIQPEVDIEWERANALLHIANALSIRNQPDQARTFLDRAIATARSGESSDHLQHSLDASSFLWQLSESLALAGEWEKAQEVADGIRSARKRDRALTALARIKAGGEHVPRSPNPG